MIPTYSKIYDAFLEIRIVRVFMLRNYEEGIEHRYEIKNAILKDYLNFLNCNGYDLNKQSDFCILQKPNFEIEIENNRFFIVFHELVEQAAIDIVLTKVFCILQSWLDNYDYFSNLSFLNCYHLKEKYAIVNHPNFVYIYYNSDLDKVDFDNSIFAFCMVKPKAPRYEVYKSIVEEIDEMYYNYLQPERKYYLLVNMDETLFAYASLINLMLFLQYMNYE